MAGSEWWRHTVWMVWVMSMAAATTSICEDKHLCVVNILPQHPKIGFLHPGLCCNEIEFPFTFLAYFFELEYRLDVVTFHLHEYYLKHVKVRVCESVFYEHHDSRTLTNDTIYNMCRDSYPDECAGRDPQRYHLRNYHFDFAVYLNITVPAGPELLSLPHDAYSGREMFNITYELWRVGEPMLIMEMSSHTYLQHCHYNGFPELHKKENGVYQFECRCVANSTGETCQWGGSCPGPTHTHLCSNHGQCQYQGGKNLCSCNEEYFGQSCEHHESTAPIHSEDCGGQLDCNHQCHKAGGTPRCLCDVGYMLINRTHCVVVDDFWDITVKFHNNHENISLKEKTYKFLHEKGLRDLNITVPPNRETKIHFTVKDREKDLLPKDKVWEDSFNSSVTITRQNVLWIGPMKKEVVQSNYLVLTCSVFGHLPLVFTWYKGQHSIFIHNVTSCSVPHVNNGKVTIRHHKGLNSKECTIQLWIEGYNPQVDWGTYTCQITDGRNTVSRTIVAELSHPLQVEVVPYVKTMEKNGNVSLSCTTNRDWDGGQHYEFSWIIEPESAIGHYFHTNSNWNRSDVFLYNVQESVNITCVVIVRENLCSSVVTGRSSQTVMVHILHLQDPHCPANVSDSTTWQATLAGQSDENLCPKGFQGKAKRKCQFHQGHKPTWAIPDFSSCIYAPLVDILMNPELILQERGYPLTLKNFTELARQLQQQLEKRDTVFLPGEYSVVLTILRRLLNPVNVPINLDIFLDIMEQIIKKMHSPHGAAIWELYDLIRTYIRSSLEYHPPKTSSYHLGDIVGKLEMLQPENISSFSFNSPIQDQDVKSLKVEVPVMREETDLYVGAVMHLNPKKLMVGATMQGRQSKENFPVELANAPVVEVMAINFVNEVPSPLSETLVSHFSYEDYPGHTQLLEDKKSLVWVGKCGGADFTNNTIVWNLGRCNAQSQNEKQGAYTCQCQGQGLFGLVMVPPEFIMPQPIEPDWEMTVVAGVCSGLVLLLILLCLMVLFPWWCVTVSGDYSLNMKSVANSCMKSLRQRHSHRPQRDVEMEVNQVNESLELKSYKECNFHPAKSVVVPHEYAPMTPSMHRTLQKPVGCRHIQDMIAESNSPSQSKPTAHEFSGSVQRRSCSPTSMTFISSYRNTVGTLGNRSLVSLRPFKKTCQIFPRKCMSQRSTGTIVDIDDVYMEMNPNIQHIHTKMVDNGTKCLKDMHRYVNVEGNSFTPSLEFESSQNSHAVSQDEPLGTECVASEVTNPTQKVECINESKIKEYQPQRYLSMTVKMS